MSKQFIHFACVLFMIFGAVSTVPAEENSSLLNNTTVAAASNVSLNGTLNATISIPMDAASNETVILVPDENQNGTSNETLNQTDLNEDVSVLNETVPVLNVTMQENPTSELNQTGNVEIAQKVSQAVMDQFVSSDNTVFAIGGGLASTDIFQIGDRIGIEKAYEVGLAPKPVRDLSEIL
jgi:hypothetical protein